MRGHKTAAVVMALALALTACGSEKKKTNTAAGKKADAVADMRKFSQCMRDNGVQMDDPEVDDSGGGGVRFSSKNKGGKAAAVKIDETKFKAAMEKCRKLMPNGGKPPKMSAADLAKGREFAKCMRENGVPDFPDPSEDGSITITKGKPGGGNVRPDDAKFEKAQKACQKFAPEITGRSGTSSSSDKS